MPDSYQPDAELASLVDALMDRRLDEEGSRRLADRLRGEPEALEYCAGMMRLDAAMQDELCPQEIEWTDTRRVKFSRCGAGPGLEVQRNQSLRFGHGGESDKGDTRPATRPHHRWSRWLILPCLLVVVPGIWISVNRNADATPPALQLWNADFEATDLTYLTEPTNRAIVDWQDYFVTENADVAEISRVTGGKVLPKSGRNVARLTNYAYLTQRLRRSDGSPLLARPGLRVALGGWAHVLEAPLPSPSDPQEKAAADSRHESVGPHGLRASLRFVAGGSPGMIQYEAASASIPLEPGEWRRIHIELTLPQDLTLPASYGVSQTTLDLNNKGLTLSLDSVCEHGFQLLLDDLTIEEVR